MKFDAEDYLAHYGTKRHSGRYPWGSGSDGDEPSSQRNKMFLDHVRELRKQGLSDTEIARGMGMTTTDFRATASIAKNAQRQADISEATRLKFERGMSNVAIAKKMGINESSVRALLVPGVKDRADVLQTTASMLRDQVDKKGMVDIGVGVENYLGVSQTRLATAVAILRNEGYAVHKVKVQQPGTGKFTEMKVLAPAGTTQKEVWLNRNNVRAYYDLPHSEDGGRSFLGIKPPVSVSSKRIAIRYAEDGGADADGVIYVRPGKDDLSLGQSRYAQVRIAVDGTHYLKGMAMYKDDLPEGVDLVFNTNKSSTGNHLDAMKELKRDATTGKIDADNPFGAVISRQSGVMNIVNEEGDWGKWSKSLSSQMLSKQTPKLAQTQLNMTFEKKRTDLDEIMSLTNPAVRKKLLESYADDADSSAVHLKAAALPRQGSHVILPINSIKENEIYAPHYRDGERVVLVRYPHGGIFEIPELTVNNRHPEARQILGNARDAVGINHKVAERLSGADFDGDTVLVIPNNSRQVKTAPALKDLKGFDPQALYPGYEGMKKMDARTKGIEMGAVSNLITDMTIRGATPAELARAVRHSMVVIDAEKHGLNWRQSAIDNGISQLKTKYQKSPGSPKAGASTLISRAGADIRVPDRKARSAARGGAVDRATGKKMFEPTGRTTINRQGQIIPKTIRSKKLAETDDAHTLSSDTPIEKIYADHSNRLKDMANQARRAAVNTTARPYSPSAKAVYSKEVADLNAKLQIALRNAPRERQALLIANATISAKRQAYPDMDAPTLKKIKAQALAEARARTGAKKQLVQITDREWEAIQAGAITNHKLVQILNNADLDQIKKLATPKVDVLMTPTKTARAKAMLESNYTQAEVADALGVSTSTLQRSLDSGTG